MKIILKRIDNQFEMEFDMKEVMATEINDMLLNGIVALADTMVRSGEATKDEVHDYLVTTFSDAMNKFHPEAVDFTGIEEGV